jgi:hypothetical protein
MGAKRKKFVVRERTVSYDCLGIIAQITQAINMQYFKVETTRNYSKVPRREAAEDNSWR